VTTAASFVVDRSDSAIADARVLADPQHQVRWVAGQVDDVVSRHAGHRRTRDRAGEPVPGFDELVLGPQVVLEGNRQTVHASQSETEAHSPWAIVGPISGILVLSRGLLALATPDDHRYHDHGGDEDADDWYHAYSIDL
jgi:hypothetical protein